MPPPPRLEPLPAPAADPVAIGPDPLQGIETVAARPAPAAPEVAVAPAPAPATATAPEPGSVDPEVSRTGRDEVALRTPTGRPRQLPYAAIRAAAVGDEIITISELSAAVSEQLKEIMSPQQQSQMSAEEMYQVKNQVAASVLNKMIDQALVLQQANTKMKSQAKAKQMFDEFIDKQWKAEELPPCSARPPRPTCTS